MSAIFDLSKVLALTRESHPSVIIIVDTNIIMQQADFAAWKTPFEKPLFLLPCMVNLELEHLKNKPESFQEAHNATKKIAEMCHDGRISEGIARGDSGIFISVPLPAREALEAELEKLSSLVKVFGQPDTEMVILARELNQAERKTPIIIATGDKNLYNAIQFVGVNSFLFEGFPMKGIEKAAVMKPARALDWDDILSNIQWDAVRRLVRIDLTLKSKSCAPKWVTGLNGQSSRNTVIVAEGTGVIHAVSDIAFSWVLPLVAWDFPAVGAATAESLDPGQTPGPASPPADQLCLGTASLDFGGAEHAVAPALREMLIKKLNNCASPMAYIEDMPTVQDPVAIMKQFFLFEFVFQDREFQSKQPGQTLDEFEKKLKNFNNLLNWAFYWLYDRKASKEELNVSFGEFLHAMRSCWSIGDTIKIEVLGDQAEMTR